MKYKYYIFLSTIIFILFCIIGYSNFNGNYGVYINDVKLELDYDIYVEDEIKYMHVEDLTTSFDENIYYDKISGKLILTTYDKFIKLDMDNNLLLKKGNEQYININMVMPNLGYEVIVSNDKIYLLNDLFISGKVRKNRTELVDKHTNRVLCFVDKEDKLEVYADDSLKQVGTKKLNAKVVKDGKNYYGYIQKNYVEYEYKFGNEIIEDKHDKVILVKGDDKISSATPQESIDMIAINMYRLSGTNTLTKLNYINNFSEDVKVLATINNGQKAANFDSDITTAVLSSQSNREKIIEQIVKVTSEFYGVNLDFGSLKLTDKENYTQFIKELAARLHSNKKILVLSVQNIKNIELEKISKVVDYVIIQAYYERTIASKISGPISSINYVEQYINSMASKLSDLSNVILEVPVYTILWTERKGTVINAEIYSMATASDYIERNNIQPVLDKVSGQNYFNYIKGITTYKMWLEDEYSITQKVKIANKYNLGGVSIYKSGMEEKNIYENILKNIK